MNEDIIARLNTASQQLHMRALELAHSRQDSDIATIMSALAVTMEAVQSIHGAVNQMDGPKGLGGTGD